MPWYKKILAKNKKEIIFSTVGFLIFTSVFSLWRYFTRKNFEWHEINPISAPSMFARSFYSALVYVTIGAFLYYIVRLWKFLYYIFVKKLKNKKLYKAIKWLLWASLIFFTYFCIVPVIVSLMNNIISFFFNILNLILYLLPVLGISFIFAFIVYLIVIQKNKT